MRVADYIANFLISKDVKDIFMLTGYGAMYINDAIEISGINYYATRNEAAAPMMAEAYARLKGELGVVCVTAGPGATNALPGLAEAFVDSAPIMIISGQVETEHTTYDSKLPLRTYGTAEINIIPIVKPLTKYAKFLDNSNDVQYVLEKAYHAAISGRPGPVWIDVPMDIQNSIIDIDKLRSYNSPNNKLTIQSNDLDFILKKINSAKKPLIVAGQGIRQGKAEDQFKKFLNNFKIPVLFSRLGQDLLPHNHPYVYGQAGLKGSKYCKKIMNSSDLVLSLGCRLAPQLVGLNFEAFDKAEIIMVDIDKAEIDKLGDSINYSINSDVKLFLEEINNKSSDISFPSWDNWVNYCDDLKRKNPMVVESQEKNPIDLYYFMKILGELSHNRNVLVTDAGSNYYVGGTVWNFEKGQREICSGTNAAMGTTIPLAIGCAVAEPSFQILAVTGDGSLELNIQELKTISHYSYNIKLFVINNGGYVSMKKWQDDVFDGRRIDTSESTGAGTLNLKKIADAFDLDYIKIDDYKKINDQLIELMSNPNPVFVEVVTDNQQRIVEAFRDY